MSSNTTASATKKMKYVRLGNSGLKVSKIILGCMSYGSKEWQQWVLEEEESIQHIKFAYDHGITTFDTADAYSNGLSEVILGKAIKKLNLPREELVIMTKLFAPVAPEPGINMQAGGKTPQDYGVINQQGLSRKHIFDGVKNSLKRLQLDYVDLLQCHRFDYDTPIEETMQALHDVVKAGYVRYIGMSSCYAYQCKSLSRPCKTTRSPTTLTPFVSMQNHYNLIYREEEREMLPTLKMFNVGCIPWSPLARGILTKPVQEDSVRKNTDYFMKWYTSETIPIIVQRVEEIAKKKGISMAQVAAAWVMSKEGITAPIIGSTHIENLTELLGECGGCNSDERRNEVPGGALQAAGRNRLLLSVQNFLRALSFTSYGIAIYPVRFTIAARLTKLRVHMHRHEAAPRPPSDRRRSDRPVKTSTFHALMFSRMLKCFSSEFEGATVIDTPRFRWPDFQTDVADSHSSDNIRNNADARFFREFATDPAISACTHIKTLGRAQCSVSAPEHTYHLATCLHAWRQASGNVVRCTRSNLSPGAVRPRSQG
ncbi:hypothetical protein NM688_g6062 [Phlebia brevispora]|uniref:Uncharacterized protein n=1 Tax=Phlebia brevispora TaxID=194682 RepID=A0ACC1SKK1_9APHY|nr:hypothetical protein NM688_g6062 [Phlebia brevispora]